MSKETKMAKVDLQTVRLNGVIVCYADGLFEKKSFEGGDPKFGASFVMVPEQAPGMTQMLERAALAAAEAKFGSDRSKWGRLRGIHKEPLIKDTADFPKMGDFPKGSIFVRASSKEEVGFADPHGAEMSFADAKRMITSGWRVNVQLRTFAYAHSTGSGVSIGINGVQAIRKVMDLGGRPSINGMFGAVPQEELEQV
jgi:Protein of unknown function (DUF2815)